MSAVVQKSPEWKARWRQYIGGGRSAAAAGIHEHMTPVELYMSMVDGVEIDPETKPDMLRGLLLEPVALQRLQMLYTDLHFGPHDQDVFILNDKYPWASDLPDAWVEFGGETIPVQIKVPSPRNWEKLDESVPDYIQCNCVHSIAVNEAPAILLACLNPVTMEVYRQIYEPEQDAIDALMEAEERFYNQYIVPRIPPPPETHEDLKLRWPEHTAGKRVTATYEIEQAWSELVAIRATAKYAERRKQNLSLTIKAFMEDGEALVNQYGHVIATWKNHLHTAFDTTRFKKACPDLWEEYAEDRPQRTFLVKPPKPLRMRL